MKKELRLIIEKQVHIKELVILAKRNVKNPLKKYNSTKNKDRKLSEEEFDLIYDSIREIVYE